MQQIEQKKVSILLSIGIFLVPIIFAWFLLKKGYSNRARVIVFAWMMIITTPLFKLWNQHGLNISITNQSDQQNNSIQAKKIN